MIWVTVDISCYGAFNNHYSQISIWLQNRGSGLRMPIVLQQPVPLRATPCFTGEYAWRRKGNRHSHRWCSCYNQNREEQRSQQLWRMRDYTTGVVGKWASWSGSGGRSRLEWRKLNQVPMDIGFDYNFLIPATGDRVPCVFVENRRVLDLILQIPLKWALKNPFWWKPTGKDHPRIA